MPVIINTQSALTRAANTTLALAFFPRSGRWIYPRLCGSTVSTSAVEPFTLDGAAPLMSLFDGSVRSQGVGSWKLQVPNLLFKNYEELARQQIEFDQSGIFLRRVNQIGVRVAASPDYLWAKRLLTASSTNSTSVVFDGTEYTTTMDGLPFFSASHTLDGSDTQSNIVQGGLPSTSAAIQNQDLAVTANQLVRDFQTVLETLQSFLDDKGANIYPSIDTEQTVVVVVPPILAPAARLAFKTPGTIGGTDGSSSGSTTSVGPSLVKDVISHGLLAGCKDIEAGTVTTASSSARVTPTNETDYYVFIVDDLVKPFYFQKFRPKKGSELMPPGYDAEAEAEKAIEAADELGLKISTDAADVYASTIVESNLSAVGSNAQASVVQQEKFFVSGRARMNFVYGPWFTGIRVKPAGGL